MANVIARCNDSVELLPEHEGSEHKREGATSSEPSAGPSNNSSHRPMTKASKSQRRRKSLLLRTWKLRSIDDTAKRKLS